MDLAGSQGPEASVSSACLHRVPHRRYPGPRPTPHPVTHLHLGLDEAHFLLQLHVFLQQPLHALQIFPTVEGLDQGSLGRNGEISTWPFSSSSLTAEGSLPTVFLCGKQAPSMSLFLVSSEGPEQRASPDRGPFLLRRRTFPRRPWGGGFL